MIKFIPDNTNINFMKFATFGYIMSAMIVFGSLALLATKGLNFGIDFKGGILMEIETPTAADVSGIRGAVGNLGLGDYSIQEFGQDNVIMVRIQSQEGGQEAQAAAIDKVKSVMPQGSEYRRVEFVGPAVGRELIGAGAKALGFSLLGILVYIWFRFEWQFAAGAIVALAHDIIATLGFFSLLQLDFNLATVAAVLTIAGYSINDTVIIYDRIREELRKYKKMPVSELINLSINKTLGRTIMTSFTTLLALFSLYFFGGEVIANFCLALIFGIVIGTFSTFFLASPVLMRLNIRQNAAPVSPFAQQGE